jgi:indolepyruvate ferredoxin oxidoreductase beta subunit
MSLNYQIVCAGIGGRGVLLASTILMETAIRWGYHAMASDEYGMSQRGGSVVSLIKIGDFKSPLIGREDADILLAFEESEFFRSLGFLKRKGLTIVNSRKKLLPDPVRDLMRVRETDFFLVDADGLAVDMHTIQASNMALLGFFSRLSVGPYTYENIRETIKERTKGKFVQKNLEVFDAGYDRARTDMGERVNGEDVP